MLTQVKQILKEEAALKEENGEVVSNNNGNNAGIRKPKNVNITKEQLIEVVKEESPVIQSLAIQLHKRLSQMIMKEKKSQVTQR